MKNLLASLKARILYPMIPEPIVKESDYTRRIISLILGLAFLVAGIIVGIVVPKDHVLQIYVYCGMVCSIPFLPKIFKITFRNAKASYNFGKAITHQEYIEVNQVSSNQYRAKHVSTHDGDFFAIAGGVISFVFIWTAYSMIAPIFTGIKTYKTAKLIEEYKNKTQEKTDKAINN